MALTAVGGGTIRDVLIRRVPSVLHSGLYAVPALIGAAVTVGLASLLGRTRWSPDWSPPGSASASG